MDSDLYSENLCRLEGKVADTIGCSIGERKQDVVDGVVDPVSGGCANDVKMSALASSGCDGGMISDVDNSGFDERGGMVESELGFSSGCENDTLDFSDVKESQEMAGTVLVSKVNGKEAEIFQAFSVFKEEKDCGVCETLESSSEVQLLTVYGHEVKQLDSFMDAEENQIEVKSILGSTHQSENLVEKRNLVNPEVVSVPEAQSHGIKMFSSDHGGDVTRDSFEIQEILGRSKTVGMVEVQEVQNADRRLSSRGGCGSCTSEITELQDIVESNPDKRSILEKSGDCVENCLQSNVGHCPSFVSEVGTGSRKEREFAASDRKRTGSSSMDTKQAMAEKKEKLSKSRTKNTKKVSEMNGNENFCPKKCNGSKRIYPRKEMEALRYVHVEEQQNMWNKIYLGLGAAVARELDNMADSKPQNQGHKNANRHQSFGKKKQNGPMLREECFQIVDYNFEGHISGKAGPQNLKDNLKEVNSLYLACDDQNDGEYGDCTSVDECDEDSATDDENNSIQKPAFLVEGDPDFESGPPVDGLEYLRRVRWEAKHIPKVKVAKVDKSKICNEQTVYMPEIPDIAKCPEHLMPSKEWEDAFLADFLKLRLTLSHLESSDQQISGNLQPHLFINGDDSCSSDLKLSAVLGMDHVSRALKLKNCIRSLESMSVLPRNDGAWLFALCAAVDTPLDADMAASLRALLRKCSSLLAGKTEFDDEVIMLNILVTLSGRYFKQSEN